MDHPTRENGDMIGFAIGHFKASQIRSRQGQRKCPTGGDRKGHVYKEMFGERRVFLGERMREDRCPFKYQ